MTMRALIASGTLAVIFWGVAAADQTDRSNLARPPSSNQPTARTGAVSPEGPRESVDAAAIPNVKRRLRVPKGGDLQRALDRAQPGDYIELENGATYEGPFRLEGKQGEGWIVVTSAPSGGLPAAGVRVSPSHAPAMAKLRASSESVIAAEPGAHHYRFVGVEISPTAGTMAQRPRAAR